MPKDKHTLKSELLMLMGVHGIKNVIHSIVDIAEEFGEGRLATADPWWLEVAAHLSTVDDQLSRLTRKES